MGWEWKIRDGGRREGCSFTGCISHFNGVGFSGAKELNSRPREVPEANMLLIYLDFVQSKLSLLGFISGSSFKLSYSSYRVLVL